MTPEEALEKIKTGIQESVGNHNTSLDAWAYNGLTVLSLGFSTAAAVTANIPNQGVAAAILSALATLCITIERSLGLGARWRFHTEMKSEYSTLIEGINYYPSVPDGRKQQFLDDWWATFVSLRKRESQIPNSGGSPKG